MRKVVLVLSVVVLPVQGLALANGPTAPAIEFTTRLSDPATAGACNIGQAEIWPQIGVDPANPQSLRAIYVQDTGRTFVGVSSEDGGRTWHRTIVDGTDVCHAPEEPSYGPYARDHLNPYMAVGAGGQAFAGSSWMGGNTLSRPMFEFGVGFHTSENGSSWGTRTSPDPDEANSQSLHIWADPDTPGRARGAWAEMIQVPNPITYTPLGSDVMTAVTTDGGTSWAEPVAVTKTLPGEAVFHPRALERPDGSLFAIYGRADHEAVANRVLQITTGLGEVPQVAFEGSVSTDDGQTWSATTVFRSDLFKPVNDPDVEGRSISGGCLPDTAMASDGSLVVAWPDPSGTGRYGIKLARSDDGITWEELPAIASAGEAFQPAVAVTPDGTIGVLYYDTGADTAGDDEHTVEVRLSTLHGSGSWTHTVLGTFDARTITTPLFDGNHFGVYQDLVATQDGFGAAYTVAAPLALDGPTDVLFTKVRLS